MPVRAIKLGIKRMNTKTILVYGVLMASVFFAGCADMKITPAGPVPDTRIQNADTAFADRIKDQLAALKAPHVKAAIKGSEVTLTGEVDNGQQLAKIAMAIQKIPGVTAVIPDVNIKN